MFRTKFVTLKIAKIGGSDSFTEIARFITLFLYWFQRSWFRGVFRIFFLSRGRGSAPVGAWKPTEINRFHWSRGGLAPMVPPWIRLWADCLPNQLFYNPYIIAAQPTVMVLNFKRFHHQGKNLKHLSLRQVLMFFGT